MKAESY